jgi:hypothetical protein
MARTVNKDALNDKITKLEKLFKAYASSKRSFEDIMRYIKSDPNKDGSDGQ